MAKTLTMVVVMAGSAGALQVMFEQVRVLVQPDNSSLFLLYHRGDGPATEWGNRLPKDSGFQVKPLAKGDRIEPGTIYYPDSGVTYGVVEGRIEVLGKDLRPRPNLDASLAALAREYGPRLLGILLSGWGVDGVNGLKAIREAGGAVIIQDPATAEVGHLPRTAVAHGVPAKILEPGEIVHEVSRILRGAYKTVPKHLRKPPP